MCALALQMGWSALHIAAHKGFDPIVRELLTRGARPNLQDKVCECVFCW